MLLMLGLGAGLLGWILWQTDLDEVWRRLREVGAPGLALVLALYALGTLALAASWLVTLRQAPLRAGWLLRLWRVWLVGTALEYTMPLGTLGGEPAKVILLKRHHGLRARDVTSSLVLARTTDLVAQLGFIGAGFALLLHQALLPLPYRVAAGSGLALLTLGVVLFFLAQQRRLLGRLRGWLERGWLRGRPLSARAVAALDSLPDIDEHLVGFYRGERARFWASTALAFLEWTSSALASFVAVNALGYPIGLADALVIEAFLGLIRSTLFFVPGDVGTQEGALVLICGALTGSAPAGLALAAIRRCRDVLVVVAGLAIGSAYSLRERRAPAAAPPVEAAPAALPARERGKR
jgi:uncharacterized protein (TIRG00374 family)